VGRLVSAGGQDPRDFTLLRLAELAERLDAAERQLGAQAAFLEALGTHDGKLADDSEDDGAAEGYRPKPAPRWWLLRNAEREASVAPLRAWIHDVYRPMYGHQAALLPECWERHLLILAALDWLSELWQVLYLQPKRSASALAGQAEWQTRYLPAAAEQMHRDATKCDHRAARP